MGVNHEMLCILVGDCEGKMADEDITSSLAWLSNQWLLLFTAVVTTIPDF